jgi:hypothetical protein
VQGTIETRWAHFAGVLVEGIIQPLPGSVVAVGSIGRAPDAPVRIPAVVAKPVAKKAKPIHQPVPIQRPPVKSWPESVAIDPSEEEHFTVAELAKKWRCSRETIRKLVCNEPGVTKICLGAGLRFTYSIPKSVAERIHRRLSI